LIACRQVLETILKLLDLLFVRHRITRSTEPRCHHLNIGQTKGRIVATTKKMITFSQTPTFV
jgi:hypothetical protein